MSKKNKHITNLSDIKFDKNKTISKAKIKKIVKRLKEKTCEIEDKRAIKDYSKLNRPTTI